jgi:hypothetical protein
MAGGSNRCNRRLVGQLRLRCLSYKDALLGECIDTQLAFSWGWKQVYESHFATVLMAEFNEGLCSQSHAFMREPADDSESPSTAAITALAARSQNGPRQWACRASSLGTAGVEAGRTKIMQSRNHGSANVKNGQKFSGTLRTQCALLY